MGWRNCQSLSTASPACRSARSYTMSSAEQGRAGRPQHEVDALIFVVFLVPLALYLLVLGWINRQSRPIIVPAVWDFLGILFAASGFLLAAGPPALPTLHERWRLFWLFGEGNPVAGLDDAFQVWLFLALLYFLLVVAGSAWVLYNRRAITCIYNTEPAVVESMLVEVCEQVGLKPVHSGNLFVFGMEKTTDSAGHNAILELDSFDSMKHVTLHWDPADSPLRPVVEAELGRRLLREGSPYHETGTWLNMAGCGLLVLALLAVVLVSLRSLLTR